MLIICNGAVKSGSTWLFNILAQLVPCQHPPASYLTGRSDSSPCIQPAKLARFLAEEDYVNADYISKNHYSDPAIRDLIMANEHVYLFDIERDPKDVIVSNYYHDCFRNGFEGSFREYYWNEGRFVADSLAGYHAMWRLPMPRFYTASYDRLKEDFSGEATAIARVLGVALDDAALESLKDKTSIGSLRKVYSADPRYQGEKFFRKGESGDWKNHFDSEMLRDIERIQDRGLPPIDRWQVKRWISRFRSRQ